jgi:hypothetical protein
MLVWAVRAKIRLLWGFMGREGCRQNGDSPSLRRADTRCQFQPFFRVTVLVSFLPPLSFFAIFFFPPGRSEQHPFLCKSLANAPQLRAKS